MKRDKEGKVKDGFLTRWRNRKLAKKLRRGEIPHGRTDPQLAIEALQNSLRGVMTECYGILSARVFRKGAGIEDLGLISVQKITVAFRDYLVDNLQAELTAFGDFKYHAVGTDNTAEANTDTALNTEVETRATGSQTEGATADIYKSVGTVSITDTRAIVEHGLFNGAASGILMDRSVFSAINVGNGDSIEFTYQATFNAES